MCHTVPTLITPTPALARLHRLFGIAACLFAVFLLHFKVLDFVEVLAALSIRAETFDGKVDAGPGFVVGGEVRFGAYFEFVVCEGALIDINFTL